MDGMEWMKGTGGSNGRRPDRIVIRNEWMEWNGME
jgi:hypothetical protein